MNIRHRRHRRRRPIKAEHHAANDHHHDGEIANPLHCLTHHTWASLANLPLPGELIRCAGGVNERHCSARLPALCLLGDPGTLPPLLLAEHPDECAMTKQPLGKLPPDAFGMLDLPSIPADIIAGFRALPDLTGMSSDAMDELGIVGAIPASVLKPTMRRRAWSAAPSPSRTSPPPYRCRRRSPAASPAWRRSKRTISPSRATFW